MIPETAPYASFETSWQPARYLADYYSAVENDERATISFLTQAADHVGAVPELLEIGCGPTVHHLFPFAGQADQIHLADYLPSNLDAVRRWVRQEPGTHDWSPFAEYALSCEFGRTPSCEDVKEREALTRRRITAFMHADARQPRPVRDARALHRYAAVLCCFCPDSITGQIQEWRRCMLNIASLVAPNGWLVLAALRAAEAYQVGDLRFPSAGVNERDVASVLAEAGFAGHRTTVSVADVADDRGHGFSSIILAIGRRSWT